MKSFFLHFSKNHQITHQACTADWFFILHRESFKIITPFSYFSLKLLKETRALLLGRIEISFTILRLL